MRIAIWYNLPSGGAKRTLYYEIKGLLEQGHTVDVWCPPNKEKGFLNLSSLVKENLLPLEWEP